MQTITNQFWHLMNISVVTNGGSNVNIVFKIASNLAGLTAVAILTGCAATTAPPVATPAAVYIPAYQAMDLFRPDCLYARTQIEMLERKLVEYQQYHEHYPYTEADFKYYRQLKNALWGLRSACTVK